MREITAQNAAEYLRETGRASAAEPLEVRELAGGVSNVVLYVRQGESAFVLKQARPQLRVAQPWFCPVERNWRELAVLRVCETLLSKGSKITTPCAADEIAARTPAVLWEDRDNYVFAMQAAPTDHVVWKQQLLANGAESKSLPNNLRIAAACGKLLAELHAASWQDELLCEQLGDVSLFEALRIDPYYRTVAAANASLRQPLEQLIESLPQNRLSLVHADFSPKNLLVYERSGRTELMMVDFETGHFGDPAFDLGFFLSHLTLKALWSAPSSASFRKLADAFWATYFAARGDLDAQAQALLARRAMLHLGACVVARVDGKSPVEYLVDPASRDAARAFGSDLLLRPKSDWNEVVL